MDTPAGRVVWEFIQVEWLVRFIVSSHVYSYDPKDKVQEQQFTIIHWFISCIQFSFCGFHLPMVR